MEHIHEMAKADRVHRAPCIPIERRYDLHHRMATEPLQRLGRRIGLTPLSGIQRIPELKTNRSGKRLHFLQRRANPTNRLELALHHTTIRIR